MQAKEIKKDIYWVGVKDWNLREFHGYATPHGSTYNSYLIMDCLLYTSDAADE